MAFKKSGGFSGGGRPGGFSRGGDRPHFANKGFSRGGDRGDTRPPQMFSATCAQCHKVCEVPFRPNGEKPVFCRDCFGGKRESPSGDYGRKDTPGRSFEKREFQPRESAPSYTSKPAGGDVRIDELKRQVDAMNKKLDTVLQIVQDLAPTSVPTSTSKITKTEPTLTAVVKKAVKKAKVTK